MYRTPNRASETSASIPSQSYFNHARTCISIMLISTREMVQCEVRLKRSSRTVFPSCSHRDGDGSLGNGSETFQRNQQKLSRSARTTLETLAKMTALEDHRDNLSRYTKKLSTYDFCRKTSAQITMCCQCARF